jgi:hypothetical protein
MQHHQDVRRHRVSLLGHLNHAAPAFADAFEQFVAPERLAHGFLEGFREGGGLHGGCRLGGGQGQLRCGLPLRGPRGTGKSTWLRQGFAGRAVV